MQKDDEKSIKTVDSVQKEFIQSYNEIITLINDVINNNIELINLYSNNPARQIAIIDQNTSLQNQLKEASLEKTKISNESPEEYIVRIAGSMDDMKQVSNIINAKYQELSQKYIGLIKQLEVSLNEKFCIQNKNLDIEIQKEQQSEKNVEEKNKYANKINEFAKGGSTSAGSLAAAKLMLENIKKLKSDSYNQGSDNHDSNTDNRDDVHNQVSDNHDSSNPERDNVGGDNDHDQVN